MLKKYLSFSSLLFIQTFLSCKDDSVVTNEPFIDRNLSGVLHGQTWEFSSGVAKSIEYKNDPYTFHHTMALREIIESSIWDSVYIENLQIPFIMGERYIELSRYDSSEFIIPGTYELEIIVDKKDFSLTFVVPSDSENNFSYGQSGGYFEILSVDTMIGKITGRLSASDILYDFDTRLYGNFEVTYCK